MSVRISPQTLYQRALKQKRIQFQKQVQESVESEKKLRLQLKKEEEQKLGIEEREIKEYKEQMARRMLDIDRNVDTKVDHLVSDLNSDSKFSTVGNLDRKDVLEMRRQNFIANRKRESEDRQRRLLFLFQSAKTFITYKNMSEKIDEALMSKSISDSNVYKRQIDFERQDLNSDVYNGKRTYLLKDILGGRYLNFDDLDTVREKAARLDDGIDKKIEEFKAKLRESSILKDNLNPAEIKTKTPPN